MVDYNNNYCIIVGMRVYFTASLRGKKVFGGNYKAIVEQLKKLGHTVYGDHILKNEAAVAEVQSKEEIEKVYRDLLKLIKLADVVVAEISSPSVSVGHEITEALEMSKPVIVMYTEGHGANLLGGKHDDKMHFVQYKMDKLSTIMADVLEEAKRRMDVRFNFFVSPKILAYLDWVAQKRMIPRSVFLRNLIEKEMKRDKGFRE